MQTRMIDRFSRDFDESKTENLSPAEVFEVAVRKFEEKCEFRPYSNYNSYRAARIQDTRKRLKRFR